MPSDNGHRLAPGRVMIIGLDGVTFDLIAPWAAAGHLPNLAHLMAQGAWGRLQSTIPAHSAPAWTTFATGLQPGKHGVYFFLGPSRDEQYFRPLSAESISGRRFWELAGEQGRSVGVVNVPLTYPLRPVANGYTIGGIFAPNTADAFSSAELYAEIIAHCGNYMVEADVDNDRQRYYADMMAGMRLRLKAAEYLLEHHPTDLFVVVFRMIDSIMHYYWADMDPNHPLHPGLDPLMQTAVIDAYRMLDDAVGRLVARAGSDTTVLIMSDHGFRAEYRRFSINKWLREQGLLTLKAGRGTMPLIGRTIKRLGLTKLAKRALVQMTGNSWQAAVWSAVDWRRTQVVYGPGPGLYVNLHGRDAHGIVRPADYEPLRERLTRELKQVVDPSTGRAVTAELYRPEEIYAGDAVALAPDLIPEPAEYVNDDGRHWGYGFEPFPGAPQPFSTAARYAGAHAPQGILIAVGPHVTASQPGALNIADLAPTTLYALGLTVPRALDGRVLTELFGAEYLAQHPVQLGDIDVYTDGKMGQVMAESEEAKVESRLRDLGYL